jgi:Glucokinase/Transketolase, thiamine diphosphate binding domain
LGVFTDRFRHAAYEQVCAGSDLPSVYDYLLSCNPTSEGGTFAPMWEAAHDRTPLIVKAALKDVDRNSMATVTLRIVIDVWGIEAGNLAPKVMATDGVYLGHGTASRMVPWLQEGAFMRAFVGKGWFAKLLGSVSVHVIKINAALCSARPYGGRDKLKMHPLSDHSAGKTTAHQLGIDMFEATDIDQLAINTIRLLAADVVQKANSRHPGTPMGDASTAYTLWQRYLRTVLANLALDRLVGYVADELTCQRVEMLIPTHLACHYQALRAVYLRVPKGTLRVRAVT